VLLCKFEVQSFSFAAIEFQRKPRGSESEVHRSDWLREGMANWLAWFYIHVLVALGNGSCETQKRCPS
jgi:hypothetical protein